MSRNLGPFAHVITLFVATASGIIVLMLEEFGRAPAITAFAVALAVLYGVWYLSPIVRLATVLPLRWEEEPGKSEHLVLLTEGGYATAIRIDPIQIGSRTVHFSGPDAIARNDEARFRVDVEPDGGTVYDAWRDWLDSHDAPAAEQLSREEIPFDIRWTDQGRIRYVTRSLLRRHVLLPTGWGPALVRIERPTRRRP